MGTARNKVGIRLAAVSPTFTCLRLHIHLGKQVSSAHSPTPVHPLFEREFVRRNSYCTTQLLIYLECGGIGYRFYSNRNLEMWMFSFLILSGVASDTRAILLETDQKLATILFSLLTQLLLPKSRCVAARLRSKGANIRSKSNHSCIDSGQSTGQYVYLRIQDTD
jgi:hypothetical protein